MAERSPKPQMCDPEEERSCEAARKKLVGVMPLRDPIGYYGSRQADNPARRIAEQHFRLPYGHYNTDRRYVSPAAPDWPVSGGPFVGKGPRGYQRSDERIRDDLAERLARRVGIDVDEIEIAVRDGEVTLYGTVKSREVKRAVEDLALSVAGVKDVHNRLRIEMPE